MERLEKVKIGQKEYPFKIDINVLEVIQEEYGSIHQWEKELLGIKEVKREDGKIVEQKSGEPSIRAIKTVLPVMINEGLKITADYERKEFEPVTEELFQNRTNYKMLAEIMHMEFGRCFVTKK